MHLLYVSQVDLSEPTGQARFDQSFLAYLTKRAEYSDFSFKFIGTQSTARIKEESNLRFIRLRKTTLGFIFFQLRLFKAILVARKTKRFDAIYVRFHPLMLAPYIYARISGTPLYLRSGPIVPNLKTYKKVDSKLLTWLITLNCRLHYKLAKNIIVVTKQIKEWILSNFQVESSKVCVISNGVDLHRFDPTRFEARTTSDLVRFCLVCTLHPSQGIEALLASFARVQQTHSMCSLDIAGAGDGEYTSTIGSLISTLGLQRSVSLMGIVEHSEVARIIHQRDVMLLPVLAAELNRTGSSSLKLYEYLAMNRFVVASRHSDHQFIEDHGLGVLYQAGDELALSQAMLRSIDLFSAAEQSGRIRSYCLEHFSSERCFGEYLRIILGQQANIKLGQN